MEKQKVYIIRLGNKRFNSKTFASYDAARNYVRKLITKRAGGYRDNIGDFGFAVVIK